MKIAGLEIPARLEFGNEAHIELRRQIENRLQLLEEGFTCSCCGSKMIGALIYDEIHWVCICGLEFNTDLDGDEEL